MQSSVSLSARSFSLAAHFIQRLKETPLLWGWLLVGLVISLLVEGWQGLGLAFVNLVLLGLYVLLIRWMTPRQPPAALVKRPRLELILALVLLGLVLVIQLFDFGVWQLQPLQGWVRGVFQSVNLAVNGLNLPVWARQSVFLAVSSTLKQLIFTLLLFFLLGYSRKAMGLTRPHWKLTGLLLAIPAAFGLLTGVLLRAPLPQVLGLYLIGIFINALPEELFFRGMLLSRLVKVFANPLNALVISALLFNLIHVPIELSQGAAPLSAVLSVFSIGSPTGLLWGYLYLRTRSILPGMFWHAANGHLGFLFMEF